MSLSDVLEWVGVAVLAVAVFLLTGAPGWGLVVVGAYLVFAGLQLPDVPLRRKGGAK